MHPFICLNIDVFTIHLLYLLFSISGISVNMLYYQFCIVIYLFFYLLVTYICVFVVISMDNVSL